MEIRPLFVKGKAARRDSPPRQDHVPLAETVGGNAHQPYACGASTPFHWTLGITNNPATVSVWSRPWADCSNPTYGAGLAGPGSQRVFLFLSWYTTVPAGQTPAPKTGFILLEPRAGERLGWLIIVVVVPDFLSCVMCAYSVRELLVTVRKVSRRGRQGRFRITTTVLRQRGTHDLRIFMRYAVRPMQTLRTGITRFPSWAALACNFALASVASFASGYLCRTITWCVKFLNPRTIGEPNWTSRQWTVAPLQKTQRQATPR